MCQGARANPTKSVFPALLVAILLLTSATLSPAADFDAKALQAGAIKSGVMNLYHNLPPPGDEGMISAFEAAYPGIKVEPLRLGSTALIQRFEAETAAGACRADAFIIVYDEAEIRWIENGWVKSWSPPEAAAFPPQHRHGDYLFDIQVYRETIVYNTAKVKPADAPKAYADLIDPKWKGKVGLNPPWRSVTVQGAVAYWDKVLGLKNFAQRL